MIRATRTEGLRGIDGVLDPSTRQMRWKTSKAADKVGRGVSRPAATRRGAVF